MAKISGAVILKNKIQETVNKFINLSLEERIKFIEKYRFLQPYEVTALLECKKFMSRAEKKALKNQIEANKQRLSKNENDAPQPM